MEKNLGLYPVQSLWIGDSLSKVEQLCIKSFLDNGHPFHLYIYDDISNLPEGVTIMDANNIVGREHIFTYKAGWGKGSYAGFADLFRFELLNKLGGWWVDTDVICLKPFTYEEDLIICSSFEHEWGDCPNSCILRSLPGSAFTDFMLREIYKADFDRIKFGDIGPQLVQRAVRELKLEDAVVPFYYFNPITWGSVADIILKKISFKNSIKEVLRPIFKPQTLKGRRILKESYAVHLWNEVWRQYNFSKNDSYPHSSIFERLKKKHGII